MPSSSDVDKYSIGWLNGTAGYRYASGSVAAPVGDPWTQDWWGPPHSMHFDVIAWATILLSSMLFLKCVG